MQDKVEKYRCLEVSCTNKKAMKWTLFLKHQLREHFKQWNLHLKYFDCDIDFQVWFKFIQENFLLLPSVKQIGSTLHATCDVASSTTCPAKFFAKRKERRNGILIFVFYMGEHYGHDHYPDQEERLFLLNYSPLTSDRTNQWLIHFRHAGVFLTTQSTPMLRKKARHWVSESKPLIVIAFMNEQQLCMLKTFHWTICLEYHGTWVVVYILVVHAGNDAKPTLSFPVAYCYSNFMDQTIVTEFFQQIKNLSGTLNCFLVMSNNESLFKGAWVNAFPETKCVFMQSWQSLITDFTRSLSEKLDFCELREFEDVLRTSIRNEYPCFASIAITFEKAIQLSETLNANIVGRLLKNEELICLRDSVESWVVELIVLGWTKSSREVMILIDSFYINNAMMMTGTLPEAMMHVTLYCHTILNVSPPLDALKDFQIGRHAKKM